MIKIISGLLLSLLLHAQEYLVIVNKSADIDEITPLQIKMIFLKKSKMINDISMLPINLNISNHARNSFEKNILRMSRNKLKSFWIEQHYFGQQPPIMMQSSQSILSFVKKIEGAIAYIPAQDCNDEVKVIYRWQD